MLVSLGLDQHIEDLALSIDRSPQLDHSAVDFQINLVEMPGRVRLLATLSQVGRDHRSEMVHPTPNRLVGHRHSAFRQQILDVTQAEGEPEVEPYRSVNDLGREAVSDVAYFLHPRGYSPTGRTASLTRSDNALAPDFKTTAYFRKDNGPAIRSACRQFVALCRRLNLLTQAIVAIDGNRFKAVNSRDRSFSRGSIERGMEQVEASIELYLSALETADRQEGELAEAKSARLKDKIGALRMRKYKALEVAVHAEPDKLISLTDPDARSMATSGKDTGMVGYK
jgi:hypothetical protein